MTEQPTWFLGLQQGLGTPVIVPDGTVINWDRCRDRFLIPMLQRLETRTSSPHPAIVRQLLERRLAGEDVTDELHVAAKGAAFAATYKAATYEEAKAGGTQLDTLAAWDAANAASWAAYEETDDDESTADRAAHIAAIAAGTDAAAERTSQLTDLRAAVAAPTQPPFADQIPPDDYIDGDITGPDRELLSAFYMACNSEGGTADEIHLRGIRAALAQAASGFIAPVPVDLAELRDSTFSDGLTAAQHRDVLRGGPDPRPPAPTDDELLQTYERARFAYQHEGAIGDDWLREERRGHTLAGLRAVLAQFNAWAQGLAPLPVADLPWEQPGWRDDDGQCWWADDRQIWWTSVDPTQLGIRGWVLPHWAIPAVPTEPAEVQP